MYLNAYLLNDLTSIYAFIYKMNSCPCYFHAGSHGISYRMGSRKYYQANAAGVLAFERGE